MRIEDNFINILEFWLISSDLLGLDDSCNPAKLSWGNKLSDDVYISNPSSSSKIFCVIF